MGLIADIETLLTDIEPVIFLGDMPEKPDNLICIYESGGYDPEYTFDGKDFEQPTFQVRVRDTSYEAGISRCEAIKDVLDNRLSLTINGRFYMSIQQQGDILPMGRDGKERAEFSLNFKVRVKR